MMIQWDGMQDDIRPARRGARYQNFKHPNPMRNRNKYDTVHGQRLHGSQHMPTTVYHPQGSAAAPQPASPPQESHPGQHILPPPKKGWRKWAERYHYLNRKQKVLLWGLPLGLLALSIAIWWFVFRSEAETPPPPPVVEKVVEEPEPTTAPSCLIGKQVPINESKKHVTGIMIENSLSARPHSGLHEAEVVYEAIAEGGITRYLALFQENNPDYVGPVRSLRPYYLDFLAPYDAAIAHAGGSAEALAQVRSGAFKDIEAFQNPNYFQRITSRYAPHNLYTNRAALVELQKSKGWKNQKCKGFARLEKEEKPQAGTRIAAQSISFDISSANYNTQYTYDQDTNRYLRNLAGAPHVDERTNTQIKPKVLVTLVTSHSYAGIYSVYGTTGSGKVFIFQNGKVQQGTWHKTGRGAQFEFRNPDNSPLKLNPGQTWVTLVGSPDKVRYQPGPAPAGTPDSNAP